MRLPEQKVQVMFVSSRGQKIVVIKVSYKVIKYIKLFFSFLLFTQKLNQFGHNFEEINSSPDVDEEDELGGEASLL